LLAFAVRALSLDSQSLWRDEVDALRFASSPLPELRARFTMAGWNGPLYHLLLRGWITLVGTSEYSLRFLSLWFGVACVALTYALGRRLFGPAVGALAALLMSTAPYLVWYGQEAKMYTMVCALALLAIYALCRAVEGAGRRWWAVQIVATSLAFYSHILAALLVPVQMLLFLLWWPQARRQWVGGLSSLACLTLPYLPLLIWQWPLVFQARETGFYPYTWGEIGEILLYAWSLGLVPSSGLGNGLLPAAMAGLTLWGLASALTSTTPVQHWGRHGSDRRLTTNDSTGLWSMGLGMEPVAWLLVPYVAMGIVSTWQPLFTDRYLIWCAPAFYLLVALGLASFLRFRKWGIWLTGLMLSLLLAGNGVNVWREATIPIKSDFRSATAFVADYDETLKSGVAVEPARDQYPFRLHLPIALGGAADKELFIFQIPYGRYTFDYYFPERAYEWADGYYTNFRDASGDYAVGLEEHAAYMASVTAGYDVVWLVLTEAAMWDDRDFTRDWLEINAQRVDEAHFTRVDVYRYQLHPAQ
jgi:uncharacterized membrane protein